MEQALAFEARMTSSRLRPASQDPMALSVRPCSSFNGGTGYLKAVSGVPSTSDGPSFEAFVNQWWATPDSQGKGCILA